MPTVIKRKKKILIAVDFALADVGKTAFIFEMSLLLHMLVTLLDLLLKSFFYIFDLTYNEIK